METRTYTGQEWTRLLSELSPKELKKALRKAIRREASKARNTAVSYLRSSSLKTEGSRTDLERGIRSFAYSPSRATGFMITVKARGAGRNGKGEKGMHTNRFGLKKPVLMWAEDGTEPRATKSRTKVYTRKRMTHRTGQMPAYGFLKKAEPDMFRQVEEGMLKDMEKSVEEAARRSGLA